MTLPIDLQKLPSQALDMLRYLGTTDDGGASVDAIIDGTGLSERSFRKAVRRLVTRYYLEMPVAGYYVLTANGQQAAEDLRAYDGSDPSKPSPEAAAATGTTEQPAETGAEVSGRETPGALVSRQLAVIVPEELVIRTRTALKLGLSAPLDDSPTLPANRRVVLRVSAPGCDVEPLDRPLAIAPGQPAGPVLFHLTPRREGTVRVKVEIYQAVTERDLAAVGGMYFDVNVAGFPTPASDDRRALGATVQLLVHTPA